MDNAYSEDGFQVIDWASGHDWPHGLWNGVVENIPHQLEIRHFLIDSYARRLSGLMPNVADWEYFLQFFMTLVSRIKINRNDYAGIMLSIYKPLNIFVNGPHEYDHRADYDLRITNQSFLSYILDYLGNIEGAVGSVLAQNESTAFEDLLEIYNSCVGDLRTLDAFGKRNCVSVAENPSFIYSDKLDISILESISLNQNVAEWCRTEAKLRLLSK